MIVRQSTAIEEWSRKGSRLSSWPRYSACVLMAVMQILPIMPEASEWLAVMGRPVIFEEIRERNIIISSKCSSEAKLFVGLSVPLFSNLAIFDWVSTEYGRANSSILLRQDHLLHSSFDHPCRYQILSCLLGSRLPSQVLWLNAVKLVRVLSNFL